MDMMSYLLGQSVGKTETNIASMRKIRQLNSDAWSWRNRAEELESENEQLRQKLHSDVLSWKIRAEELEAKNKQLHQKLDLITREKDEGFAAATQKIQQLHSDVLSWRIPAEELEAKNKQLHQKLDLITKRFLRERDKRMDWQKAAIFRKLILFTRGMTQEQVVAEQQRLAQITEINDKVIADLREERKMIDREFGIV